MGKLEFQINQNFIPSKYKQLNPKHSYIRWGTRSIRMDPYFDWKIHSSNNLQNEQLPTIQSSFLVGQEGLGSVVALKSS